MTSAEHARVQTHLAECTDCNSRITRLYRRWATNTLVTAVMAELAVNVITAVWIAVAGNLTDRLLSRIRRQGSRANRRSSEVTEGEREAWSWRMGTLETKSGSADIGASPNFPNRLYGLRVWTRYTATEEDQFPGRLVRVGLKKRGSQPIKEHSECGPIYMVLTRVGAERLEGSIALEPGMGVVLGPVPRREEMHRQGKPGMQGRTLYALLQEFENRYPREPERVHVALTYPLPPSETKRAAERRRWQSVVRILEEIQVRYDLPEEWEPTPLDDKTLNDNAREVMLARIRILSYICNYKGQACIAFQSLQSPKEEENDAEDRTGITSPETERVIALYQRSNDLALLDDDHMIYLLGYR